jgi:hypothetical protein
MGAPCSLCVCVHLSNNFCIRIYCRGKVFTEPFRGSSSLFWLHYSDFQESFHIALKSCWTRCFLNGQCLIKY